MAAQMFSIFTKPKKAPAVPEAPPDPAEEAMAPKTKDIRSFFGKGAKKTTKPKAPTTAATERAEPVKPPPTETKPPKKRKAPEPTTEKENTRAENEKPTKRRKLTKSDATEDDVEMFESDDGDMKEQDPQEKTETSMPEGYSDCHSGSKQKEHTREELLKFFRPCKNDAGKPYDVINDAGFTTPGLDKKGRKKSMPYMVVAKAFRKVEATTKRLEKIDTMANLYRSVIALAPDQLLKVVYLTVNKIAPPYEGLEMGVGDSIIMKAISQSTGRAMKDIKAHVEDKDRGGDLGVVAEQSRMKQKCIFGAPPALQVDKVFDTFIKLAKTKGNKSMTQKVNLIKYLFVSAKKEEARYMARHLENKMRLGFAEQNVFSALARAIAWTPTAQKGKFCGDWSKKVGKVEMVRREQRFKQIVGQVFSEMPNYERVITALVEHGIEKLHHHCHLTPGIPVKAMLAKPTTGITEILERFKDIRFTLEFKYDGERAQIHLLPTKDGDKREYQFFSRSAECNTAKFPDLADIFHRYLAKGVTSFILDSEVVAYDRVKKQILPFQVLSHRKRKDVDKSEITIQVCVYAFDLLYLNGQSLIRRPFAERRKLLHDNFLPIEGEFQFAHHKDSRDPEEIQTYLDLSVASSCEGLMVKTLDVDATYEPSKRSHNWLKCKKDYLEGVGDTLDLVPLGGFNGNGKRAGFYGSILVGCFDEDSETYQSICKIGTGFKDEDLKRHTEFYNQTQNQLPKKPTYYAVTDSFKCDVWFKPLQVWEVKCADMTVSPTHMAGVGLVHESKGIALRFPRFVRLRDDKQPEDATNSDQVADMYRSQDVIKNNSSGPRR